jgi:hypothetical protein
MHRRRIACGAARRAARGRRAAARRRIASRAVVDLSKQ